MPRDATLGIVGCGNIFDRYARGLARFPGLRIARCADIDLERAEAAAQRWGIPVWSSVDALLADATIDVVVILTPPLTHSAVVHAALDAGKHVYVEKPLAATLPDAQGVVERAGRLGRRLGAAPDTFLGSAGQTARAVLDSGEIGDPIGAAAFVTHSRAERWHPDPTFLFKPGGGPVLDLGPYHVTALVQCLGPVRDVSGRTRIGAPRRAVTAPERRVEEIVVEVPTHASAVLEFASGVVGTVMMSFDIWHRTLPYLEIYGTHGALSLPDPNTFDGDVKIRRHTDEEWRTVPPVISPLAPADSVDQYLRGIGVADLVDAVHGGPHRANARLAYHVLETLIAIQTASDSRAIVRLDSSCERPAPLTRDDVERWTSSAVL
jgi:predicted dehydrogenase